MNSPILPGENHVYPEADWPERERIIQRHLHFALGLMWFLQNDESVAPGGHNLEQQVCAAFVDGQIAQLIKEEKLRVGVMPEPFLQRAVDLCRGQRVDHVHDAGELDGEALFTRGVPQGIQEMRFSRSGGPNQHGTPLLRHEVAVEQSQDGLFGDPLGEGEVILRKRLAFGQAGATEPPLQGSLPADDDFFADQGGQHVEDGTLLAGRLVEHFLIQLGDAVEFQFRQVGEQFFVAWRGHGEGSLSSESPQRRSYRAGSGSSR